MKEQDAKVDCESHQYVLYVERGNGKFGPLTTGSFMVKDYMDEFIGMRKRIESDAIAKYNAGEISSVGYYSLLQTLTPADVAARTGVSASAVKKHMQPQYFTKLPRDVVQKYADVYNVSIEEMYTVAMPKNN